MAKSKYLKLIDIAGEVVVVNLDDVSFISTELEKTIRIKFKGSDVILHFDHIVDECIEKIIDL